MPGLIYNIWHTIPDISSGVVQMQLYPNNIHGHFATFTLYASHSDKASFKHCLIHSSSCVAVVKNLGYQQGPPEYATAQVTWAARAMITTFIFVVSFSNYVFPIEFFP